MVIMTDEGQHQRKHCDMSTYCNFVMGGGGLGVTVTLVVTC